MKCPICGTSLPPLSDRCPDCGFRCRTAQPQTTQAVPTRQGYTPPNKTKTSRGCCCALILVIPVVILIAVMIFAAVRHITADFSVGSFDGEIGGFYDEFPFGKMTPESLPAAADEGCFAVADHTLMFLRDNWDGSPVLRIPDTVGGETITSIGVGCFAGCEELTTIVLPETVTAISPMAFSGCTSLRGLFLPEGVELIGKDAFDGCASLEAIHIPASVQTVAPGVFEDCASLRYIFYSGMHEDWNDLYPDYITPFTAVICLDGDFYHGVTE